MNTNKYLLFGILAGLFSLPFIPLIVFNGAFFPFIVGKNFVFRIIVEIIFALWAILAIRDEKYRPKFSWVLASSFGFLAVMTVADAFGENPAKSFWSNFERMEGLVTLLHLFGYFLVAGIVLEVQKLWSRFFLISLGASFLVSLYGFSQLFGWSQIHQGGVRLDASLGNATYLAIYLIFHIFLSLFFLLRSSVVWQKVGFSVLALLELVLLYHTATRGAILGFIGGLGLFSVLIALFAKEEKALRKFSLALLAGIAILVGGFYLARDTVLVSQSDVLSRFASISPNFIEDKTQARGYVWPMAIEGFKERPILGWGQENFNYVFNKYYDPRMYTHEQWFDRTHNVILDWMIAGGILGLFFYLTLFFSALFVLWKKSSLSVPEKSLFAGLFFAYFFHNLFVFDNITSYLLFFTALAFLHAQGASEFPGKWTLSLKRHFEDRNFANRFYIPLVILATLFSLYFWNMKPLLANTSLIQAIHPERSLSESLLYFEKALSYDSFGNQEIREQLVQKAVSLRGQSANLEEREKIFSLAKTEMEKMNKEAPNDVRHKLFFGALLNAYGEYGTGLLSLEAAEKLSPGKQSILFEMAGNYLSSGKYTEALRVLERAYSLAPDFPEAQILYAVGAIYAGNNTLAEKLLSEDPTFVLDDRVIRAYFDTRQYEKVVGFIQERIKRTPQDPNIRFSLAALYMEIGQRQSAIRVLREAALAIPSIAPQAQSYITEIEAGRNP